MNCATNVVLKTDKALGYHLLSKYNDAGFYVLLSFFHNTETSVFDLHAYDYSSDKTHYDRMHFCRQQAANIWRQKVAISFSMYFFLQFNNVQNVLYIFFLALRSLYIFRLRCRIAVEHAQLNSQVAFSVLVFFYSRNGRIGLLIIQHLRTDDSVIDRLLFIELTKNKK